ncbi:hypothetical protein [Vreelandella massiliensis]|uniref:hypothetical protein n=1 Tax=Vreelandella massiliensis TaxID=1816686 RepID=UPI00096A293F|nr:hypothetical protein [Halomonas massiliensis]
MDENFDPAAFDALAAESERPLEEVSSRDIALETLEAVCREMADTPEDAESLWSDVRHLYKVAAVIEDETLGRDTVQQGKSEARSLIEREGADLFDQFNGEVGREPHA